MTLVLAEVARNIKSVMGSRKIKLGKYRHYKGKDYKVICVVRHSETLEDLVVYEALYENKVSKFWARPLRMFLENVEVNGYAKGLPASGSAKGDQGRASKKIPRFKYIGK